MDEPARTIIKALNGKKKQSDKEQSKAETDRAIVHVLKIHNESLRAQNIALQSYGEAIANLAKSLSILNTILIEIAGEFQNLGSENHKPGEKGDGT